MNNTDALPIKELLTAASPLIKAVVDTYVTPKLENIKKRFSTDYKKYHIPTEEHFSEYFHRTYKRVSLINTLVFNNSEKYLKDIYIPLTLLYKTDREVEHRFKINSFPSRLLAKSEKILITDNAGMGKSTLVKKIFLDTIDQKKGIPIIVELRRLSKDKTIVIEIQEQINSLVKDFDNNLLLELLSEGGFVILLDGYDEIQLSERDKVTIDIQSFISKASNNKFILTSRPENALTGFGDFKEVKIEPLKRKEAFELLRKYDKKGSISSLLIKKLEETEMENVFEFLTNPLLVSLLFTAFKHKQTIPFKKYIFYRQVYDANFELHDLTKGDSFRHHKYCKLEIDDFHRVLRHIGISCLQNNQRIEFNKDEILFLIKNAKSFCVNLTFNESDFLKDLISTVPIFTQDGIYYRWAHKSLQEYFAAQFIYHDAKDQQYSLLMQMYNNNSVDKFINILDLYYDIDPKTFRFTILHSYLKTFKNHVDTTFTQSNELISVDEINFRRELYFLAEPFMYKITDEEESVVHDNIDNMINRFCEDKRTTGSIESINYDNRLFCLINFKVKDSLSRLLVQKIPELFYENDYHNQIDELNIKYSLSKDYIPYYLNDQLDDQFNTKENFNDVSHYIQYNKINSPTIMTKKALDLFEEIEQQIAENNSNNFSIDGIIFQ